MSFTFIFTVPQTYFDPKTGKAIGMGEIIVYGKATQYRWDGTIRTVDIDLLMFGGQNVTKYICACQPDKWDELMQAAEQHAKSLNNESC
jgi:hypothetical protein